jgi:hypothetical protein
MDGNGLNNISNKLLFSIDNLIGPPGPQGTLGITGAQYYSDYIFWNGYEW